MPLRRVPRRPDPSHGFVIAGRWFVIAGRWFVIAGRWFVIAGRWFVIAGLTRNPVVVWHWIPDRVRDDKLDVRDDKLDVRDDKLDVRDDKAEGRGTFAESPTVAPSTSGKRR
jgi:formate dehydrogenase subunit delta